MNDNVRSVVNHKVSQRHPLDFPTIPKTSLPLPHTFPPHPKVSSPNCKSFLVWECLGEGESTQFGPSLQRHRNKDVSPANQQMLRSSSWPKRSIYIKLLFKMNSCLSPAPAFPCPASIRHASGFQIDSVSSNNRIRNESLRGLPREGGTEGTGWGRMYISLSKE